MSNNIAENPYWQSEAGKGLTSVSPKVSFPDIDHLVMEHWEQNDVFRKSIQQREGQAEFVAYDGPPGTNGEPHIGHMMQSALKDLWPRYKTMRGFKVRRKAGWDTHGLPIELTAEKELGLKTKRDILTYGVEPYIEYCRSTVYRFKDSWTYAIKRIGRFLDTDDFYATYTNEYIQSDWWVLKQAWEKDLLFQGRKVMPHCARCGTSLSSHETAQGYKDITDISLFVKFRVKGTDNRFFVAWTTTAWTLLSNVALCVNPELKYLLIKTQKGEELIFAESRLDAVKHFVGECEVLETFVGKDLEGMEYLPLWEFQSETREPEKIMHRVFADNYVTADDGSGIVHLALYGEDDARIINERGVAIVQNVDIDGIVGKNVTPFAGRYFREEGLDIEILKDLSANGLLLGKEKIVHSYPHCYRCDSALMYFAKSGWFLRTSSFKDEMLKANREVKWYPEHIRDGRFGNWLENNVDWAISRERYWGSPLPIWTCGSCNKQECFGSVDELQSRLNEPLSNYLKVDPQTNQYDLHKPWIDNIKLTCVSCNGVMTRVPEVLDSWFNAGIMPWGQWGYPNTKGSKDVMEHQFPADFICEAIDQTRGWFYTLLAISTLLEGQSSFKNVICTELVLDKDGLKMSKSRGNVVNPIKLSDKYGSDSVRWNFYRLNPWTVRRFNEDELPEVLKQVFIPFWNAYTFFVTYAIVDGWQPSQVLNKSERLLDRWILSKLTKLQDTVEKSLDGYDVAVAAQSIYLFIDDLTNWYIRRSRRRFWKSVDDGDKRDAYSTLYTVLVRLNRLLAPFAPFVTEVVYQNLERGFDETLPLSVHLTDWIQNETAWRDDALESSMDAVRKVVSIALSLRTDSKVRVRQPLASIKVHGLKEVFSDELKEIIMDELNIKLFETADSREELLTFKAKPNMKSLGIKFGKEIHTAGALISVLSDADVARLFSNETIAVNGFSITQEDVFMLQEPASGLFAKYENGITVALDSNISDSLRNEWLAREFVHSVQKIRKDLDLNVTDRVDITFVGSADILSAVSEFELYIRNETLALSLNADSVLTNAVEVKIGDNKVSIQVSLVTN